MRNTLFIVILFIFSVSTALAQVPPGPQALDQRLFTGKAADDRFGTSVASAGDVNGDGYDDLIVGANGSDQDESNIGAAYVYFGGKVVNLAADVVLTGEVTGDNFGIAVAGAGDVNGDGYSDVIVGAHFNDEAGTDAGRAYIYYGGASMDAVADVVLTGEAAGDFFGKSVAGAGDVNGDGYADVLVGAYTNDAGGSNAGRAYVYYGSASMDATVDVTMTGVSGEQFGYSVSEAGDVNGDGYADVLVGAYANDGGRGAAYLYYGGASMDAVADVTLVGDAANDLFGYSVSGADDVNGDGYADLIVGAIGSDMGGADAGQAYLYHGGTSMDAVADVVLKGEAVGDFFGSSVSGMGDMNGDGYGEVVVGALSNDAAGTNAGRAYVYTGGAVMDAVADMILTGEATFDNLGVSVSGVGDVNGDGYVDFMVGAFLNDTNGGDAGRAYLYLNSLIGNDLPDEVFTGVATGDQFGYSVSSAGDVNGDGYADFIVGANANDGGRGAAYLYHGGPSLDQVADVMLTGESAGDFFGYAVSSAGDLNGDGYADLIVGADRNDAGGSNAGRAYVYYGSPGMDRVADVILTGEAGGDNFGLSVSSAGDVNGDGYSDVVVGAAGNDTGGADVGRAYIYYGGPGIDSIADVVMMGEAASNYFGSSVSSAGDVNGDGYGDVIVGAWANDTGGANAGRAYVYFGGPVMDDAADVTITGGAAGDYFGASVSGAGDVNGDGYADVVVGAWGSGAGGSFVGRAYVYYGGAVMNNGADVVMMGQEMGDYLGSSVSGGGDMNGDGFEDVMVGAYAKGSSRGQAYVYYGGASMNNSADVVMNGEANDDFFSYSVSGAGDVNGDGYADAIVGAIFNDAGGADAGRAYLYLSSPPAIIPRIIAVTDIAGDQGGYVVVKWMRSGYDFPGIDRVTSYRVERSEPPGTNGFAWETLTTLPATYSERYSYAAPTYSDQTEGNNGSTFFRITALTEQPAEFWRSAFASGASIDNLAPLTPQNPDIAQTAPETITLSWDENTTDPDVFGYTLYRSTTDGFTPSDTTRLATTTSIAYTDLAATGSQPYFYRITTQDVHGNESPPTEQLAALTYVNLKVLLEGPYKPGGTMRNDLRMADLLPLEQPYGTVEYLDTPSAYAGQEAVTTLPNGAVDWVLVEVRSGPAASDSLTTRAGVLMKGGWVRDLDGVSVLAFGSLAEGSYYVVIRQRNHLSVMSSVPVAFSMTVPSVYNFTSGSGKAYGTGSMKEVEAGVWALYSGDGDASGGVTASDQALWLLENGLNGYQVGDYNLSGGSTASDQALWLSANGLNSQVPE